MFDAGNRMFFRIEILEEKDKGRNKRIKLLQRYCKNSPKND